MAAVPIRSWEDEMQPETLLMVEAAEVLPAQVPSAPTVPAPAAAAAEPAADLSTLPAVIWQADPATFEFTYVGGAVEQISGYPAAHWLSAETGLLLQERIHPDDRAEIMALYQSLAAEGGEASAEFRFAGAGAWCRETIRVPTPGEGSGQISGVLTAIGARRQLEAQALEAGRIDALRGLASRLAHELNNPLMIVSGYGEELLRALPEGDSAHGDLTEILSACGRIGELAGSMLAFTRAQAKAPAKIALNEVVTAIEPRLREMVKDLGIAFPAGAVWTFAEAGQLGEALAALAAFLIENSHDASKLTVTCRTTRVAERTGTANFTVRALRLRRDPSRGSVRWFRAGRVSEVDLCRAKDSRKDTSLAVTCAYLNVRQWGGDVAYASHRGDGSAFHRISIERRSSLAQKPVSEAPPAEPDSQQPGATALEEFPVEPIPGPVAPEPEPSLGTILVVEDEPGIRGLVRKILRRERYDVIEAGSAEEALAAAVDPDFEIDLLLTDVMLPGMGGRELAESLTAAYPAMKVVYVSGFTDDEGVRAGEFPPGSSFLQKPFTLSALVGAVREALEP